MCLTTPEAVRGERHLMRIADQRRRHSRCNHVERVVPADAVQVEHFRSAIDADTRRKKVLSMRLAQQRSDHVATGIEIGGHEQQFAEPRLPQVFDEHLRESTTQRCELWARKRCSAANEYPQRVRKS